MTWVLAELAFTLTVADATDGYPVWSQTYDGTASDVFQIEDGLTRSRVDDLSGTLLAEDGESCPERARTSSIER